MGISRKLGLALLALGCLLVTWLASPSLQPFCARVFMTHSRTIRELPKVLLTRVEDSFANMEKKIFESIHQPQSEEKVANDARRVYAQQLHDALVPPSAYCTPHPGILYAGDILPNQTDKQVSAVACCAACSQQGDACSVWSWCGREADCGTELHTCVLRNSSNPTQPLVLQAGAGVPWTSGVVVDEAAIPELYRKRDMDAIVAPTMLLGIRKGPATISTISPRGEPAFSFAAPHDLQNMNRTGAGYHHLGDITVRVRQGDAGVVDYLTISTVTCPNPDAEQPPPPSATPMDGPPAHTDGRGVKVYAHVDLAPQLPKVSPITITRWIEVPDVNSTFRDIVGTATGAGKTMLPDKKHSILLKEEVRMYWNISHMGNVDHDLELGSLALSMPFDQIFADRTLETVAVQCSFVEAYPGGQLGYIQVTRAHGGGPVLLVLPAPDTPTSFEAWRPLQFDDASIGGFGFEGHHELMLHSKAYADKEWSSAKPWVVPTNRMLKPWEIYVVGVRLILAAGPEEVESALLAAGHPVVVGVPGFVVHADMEGARLFVKHSPSSMRLDSVQVFPTNALEVVDDQEPPPHGLGAAEWKQSSVKQAADTGGSSATDCVSVHTLSIRPSWTHQAKAEAMHQHKDSDAATDLTSDDPALWAKCGRYDLKDEWRPEDAGDCSAYVGRVRLQLRFRRMQPVALRQPMRSLPGGSGPGSMQPDLIQWVQVMVLPPARALVRQYGLTSANPEQGWLPREKQDPWGRSPAFMGYDNEEGRALMWDLRVYMAGLSDESGAAQPLAMAFKQLGSPSADQIAKLEAYVHETLYTPEGQNASHYIQAHDTYAVRTSMLYNSSEPWCKEALPEFIQQCADSPPSWQICWDYNRSMFSWRANNYPHVAGVYWSLYRLARVSSPPLATRAPWQWYLKQAVETMKAMWTLAKHFGQWGQVVGSVFKRIAHDVRLEGWTKEQEIIDQIMKERIAFWQSRPFPFGSEMSWDNTGHEEIAAWLSDVGDREGEEAVVRAVTAYMGLYPSWALAGSARRWWDFFINGKLDIGNERGYHHYAAALNAMPLMDYYRKHPDNTFLLRLATAGNMGSLTNIMPDGGASMGWHGNPAVLKPDGYSADYGIGFYGHWSQASGTVTCDASLGWLCFNCDIATMHSHTASASGSADVCAHRPRVQIALKDAFRRQLFIAPVALLITVDNAWITGVVDIDFNTGRAVVMLATHDLHQGDGEQGVGTEAVAADNARGTSPAHEVVYGRAMPVEQTAIPGQRAAMAAKRRLLEAKRTPTVAIVTVERTVEKVAVPSMLCGEDGPPLVGSGTVFSPQGVHGVELSGASVPCSRAAWRGPDAVLVPSTHASGLSYIIITWGAQPSGTDMNSPAVGTS